MRGLIEKDLRFTLNRKQTLLIFFVMAIIMAASMNGTFLISYLTMLGSIVAVGTLSYDEADNGYLFLLTLPFSRKTYIREKYLFTLLLSVVSWLFGAILYFAGGFLRHEEIAFPGDLPMLMAVIPTMYMAVTILIPLQLKYGVEKSRMVMFLLFGVIALAVVGGQTLFEGKTAPLQNVATLLDSLPSASVLLLLTAVSALIAFISYSFSIRIMEKKEF